MTGKNDDETLHDLSSEINIGGWDYHRTVLACSSKHLLMPFLVLPYTFCGQFHEFKFQQL
jgi:hypothetical protein